MELRKKLIVLSVELGGDWYGMYKVLSNDPTLKSIKLDDDEKYVSLLEGVDVLTIVDDAYPNWLKEEKNPPFVLYYRGNISLLYYKKIALCGSINLTNYGIQACKKIFSKINTDDVAIVYSQHTKFESVIDELNMKKSGKIKILTSGNFVNNDTVLNRMLDERVEKKLVLSIFPPNVKTNRRTISWNQKLLLKLSDIVFCVEIKKDSHCFKHVESELNEGKCVYILPASYDLVAYNGGFHLLNTGAKCFFEIEGLIGSLNEI